jgi:hypothetical protein
MDRSSTSKVKNVAKHPVVFRPDPMKQIMPATKIQSKLMVNGLGNFRRDCGGSSAIVDDVFFLPLSWWLLL